MQYALTREQVEAGQPSVGTPRVLAFFDDAHGCEKFVQRLLVFAPGSSEQSTNGDCDEVLYVLTGSAVLTLAGERVEVGEGMGVFLRRATAWSVACDGPLEIISVRVRTPVYTEHAFAVVDLAAEGRRNATAARQFTLGVRPEVGCATVTQFIGFVPPGRAPDHYHHYDEVICILDGQGVLHIGGETAPLAPGVCVHLPARLVHSLENTGASELQLLGVFTPAGSPAEAYYPDGTPAAYPKES